jgi:hypothetical protein
MEAQSREGCSKRELGTQAARLPEREARPAWESLEQDAPDGALSGRAARGPRTEVLVTRKFVYLAFAIFTVLSGALSVQAQVKVSVDYNVGGTAEFKFKTVPTPAKDDAGSKAKFALVIGELDPNGADFNALTDGSLPASEDQPAVNLFFNLGGTGGRFRMDLGSVIEISQVNSYSWHPDTRGPQVYLLYASDGADPKFNGQPNGTTDPTTVGWKLLATVDTRPKSGRGGGQYGVSITDSNGALGKYRYLLFDCLATEMDDDWGNTFYSEVDVIAKKPN